MDNKIVLSTENAKKLDELKATLPIDKQLSWLQLGNEKAKNKKVLEDKYLELQVLLVKYDSLPIKELQDNIALYKKGLEILKDLRKGFTKYVDKISADQMTIEKNAEVWEVYEKAQKHCLELRLNNEKVQSESNDKIAELSKFKVHVTNEFIRVKTELELMLGTVVNTAYVECLKENLNEAKLKNKIVTLENHIYNIPLVASKKFRDILPKDYVLLNDVKTLEATGKSLTPPDYKSIRDKKVVEMKDKFKLYFSDKANADKAIEYLNNEQTRANEQIMKESETRQAVNVLSGKSSTGTLSSTGIKPVERNYIIVIDENNPDFLKKVITEFLSRFDSCRQRLKIKFNSKLTVAQMVSALQGEPDRIDGFTYKEVQK